MDLDELRAFLAVARTGSLAAAAKDIRVVRSTLVRRIAALERRLDLRLIRRTDQGISLTAPGQRLAESGSRMLALAESAEALVLSAAEASP